MSLYASDSNAGDVAQTNANTSLTNNATYNAQIENAFSGYDDAFYNKSKTAYLNYALPEINKQYGDTRKETIYGLANRGLVNSSAANEQFTNLAESLTSKRQSAVNTADSAVNTFKSEIDTAKNSLRSQLNTATDLGNLSTNITTAAAQYSSPSYSTIPNDAFADFTSALSNRYSLSNLGSSTTTNTGSTNYTGSGSSYNNSSAAGVNGTSVDPSISYTVGK